MDEMEESARKRKREEEGEVEEVEEITPEQSKEATKIRKGNNKKQRKMDGDEQQNNDELGKAEENDATAVRIIKAEKKRMKRERKRSKEEARVAKMKAKKERKEQKKVITEDPKPDTDLEAKDDEVTTDEIDMDPIEIDDTAGKSSPSKSTTTTSSKAPSPIFDAPNVQSGTSSISSITAPVTSSKPSQEISSEAPQKPRADPEELRLRLQQKLEALRAARKADKEDGSVARTREELIESRRKKTEQRKAHKKALRQQAKEEEQREKALALSRGSPLLSPSGMSPAGLHGQSPLGEPSNNFSFGRISFKDGHTMTANLDSMLDPHKAKGPQDARTALEAAGKRAERLSALDPNKRADIEEKDMWLNARKRAHGERVRDDTSLLKKALKRKEKQKKKSEKEWSERLEGVAKGQAARQKKREDNLQKRREEKGGKGKKKGKGATKKKARPGFEGSFRAGGKK